MADSDEEAERLAALRTVRTQHTGARFESGSGASGSLPKMLGTFPIHGIQDVYNVYKMDVISEALSPWGTHPEFAAIRTQLLSECSVSDEMFTRFESSLSPHEHGNLLDFVDDLQLGVDFSDARDLFIVPVQLKLDMVLDEMAITAGRGSPASNNGSTHADRRVLVSPTQDP
jgi:hypothetical protein